MKETAGVLLYRRVKGKAQVLLVYNGRNWSIPKGKIEKGEDRKKAALRELFEETGLTTKEVSEIGYVDRGNTERLFCFLSEAKEKVKPVPSEEIIEAAFLDLPEALLVIKGYQRALLEILPVLQEVA